MKGAA